MPSDDEADYVARFNSFFTDVHDADITATVSAGEPITINWTALNAFDGDLAADVRDYPDDLLGSAREALREIDADAAAAELTITDLPRTPISELRSRHLGQLVNLYGTVTNVSTPQSLPIEAAWTCQRCGTITRTPNTSRHRDPDPPHECQGCEQSGALDFDHEHTEYRDAQTLLLTERKSEYGGYDTAEAIHVELLDELVGAVKPGDHVAIHGTLQPEDPGETNQGTLADKYLHAIGVTDANPHEHVPTSNDDAIQTLATDDDIYRRIVESIAPSVHGYDHEKLAIALQLFSGVQKTLPDETRVRGDIHVLLVGDPGVAKTQLLDYAARLAPSAVKVSGKEATAAGLTATATREGRGASGWKLQGGALVLGNDGLVCLDDFANLTSNAQEALHGVLETQEVRASKATATETLAARTAVLGASNPKYGRFDQYEPIGEQVDLTPDLISQFDLIFTIIDKPDPDHDADLVDHALDAQQAGEAAARGEETPDVTSDAKPDIAPDVLREYIAYARQSCYPTLTDDAKRAIREFYVDLRAEGYDDDAPVPVTTRKLEALVRLAEASARMRLSDTIEEADAERVIELVKSSLESIGVQPETGEFDADIVETGVSKRQREGKALVKDLIEDLQADYDDKPGAPVEDILDHAEADGMDRDEAEKYLTKLKRQGDAYVPQNGYYRAI